MGLDKQFTATNSDTANIKFMGTEMPPWYRNSYAEVSRYNTKDIYYHYNYVDNRVYIQYGLPIAGWATNKFYAYDIKIANEEEKEGGVINFDLELYLKLWVSRKAPSYSTSRDIQVHHTIYFDDKKIDEFRGLTKEEFVVENKGPFKFNITLGPEESTDKSLIFIDSKYPNHEYPDESIKVGMRIVNTNKKITYYIPMAIRQENEWKSLNKNKGFIKIRQENNKWVDKSQEIISDKGKENKGHNRIRKSGKWLQQKDF